MRRPSIPGGQVGQPPDDELIDEIERRNDKRFGEIDAQIGFLRFKDEFSDPNVEINHERQTAEHEIVSGHSAYRDENSEFVVQALGRSPTQITIEGWIAEDQLDTADRLVGAEMVNVVTARWTGTAVPETVDVPYSRTYHDVHGWIFNTTFELIGANRDTLIDGSEEIRNGDQTTNESFFYDQDVQTSQSD